MTRSTAWQRKFEPYIPVIEQKVQGMVQPRDVSTQSIFLLK